MKSIKHEGVVEKVSGQHVSIRITSLSACAACHAKSACTVADSSEKLIDIYTKEMVKTGQRVMIVGNQALGFKAAWLAYLLPAILVIAVLSITVFITNHEGLAGILALAVLVPYFTILKMINNRLRKTFSFKIEPINE
ncbi:MAG: SoxR reducing system RseC family protein [Cytophagaceae bacterium]|jgi:sigma-E factor negative regulatory protein RseC|nr:SoxR reducing system RseC family protein [Cytophagaceae bacterium]